MTKEHAVHPFNLAVGSRMGNGDIFDRDASVFVEVPKVMASKCSSKVGNDAVRETESVDDVFEELDCIEDGSGLIEPSSESLADQCSRGRVVAAGTRVNFEKLFQSLFLG